MASLTLLLPAGVRLYFSYYRRGYGGIRNTSGPPTGLELIHVRLPPSNLTLEGQYTPSQPAAQAVPSYPGFQDQQRALVPASSPPIKFTSISASAVVSGGVLLAPQQTAADNIDVLLLTCPDLGLASQPLQPNAAPAYGAQDSSALTSYGNARAPPSSTRPPLVEQTQALAIEGRTWAVAEIPHPLSTPLGACLPSLRVPGRGELRLNEIAAQTEVGPRGFLILTSEGMHVVEKRLTGEVLRSVLESNGGGSQGEVVAFFDL